jgi:hypothetical protein
MFGSGDVEWGAAMQVTARHLRLIEFEEFAGGEAFLDDRGALGFGTVADQNAVRLRERRNFVHPFENPCMRE